MNVNYAYMPNLNVEQHHVFRHDVSFNLSRLAPACLDAPLRLVIIRRDVEVSPVV